MLERLHTYTLLAPLSEDVVRETREATYRAEDGTERRVWLDVVSLTGATPEMRERFTEDAEAATRLRHEALLPLLDHGMDAGFAYAAYELCESIALAELIETSPNGRLDPELVALIGMDVAAGLASAHGRRPALVHGALDPTMVHMHADGQARIQGWAAPALWRSIAVAGGSVGDGTAYLSPEIVQERPLTKRTDLFSLGSTLYEALLGRRAFDAPTPLATGIKIRIGTYERLEQAQPEAPAALRQMVGKMLSAEPAQRPSPLSLRNALSTVVRDDKALRTQMRERLAPPPVELPPSTGLVMPVEPEAELFAYQPSQAPATFDDSTSLDSSHTDSEVRVPEYTLDSLSEPLPPDAAPMFAMAEPTMAQPPLGGATIDQSTIADPAMSDSPFGDGDDELERDSRATINMSAPLDVTEEHDIGADSGEFALPKTEVIALPADMNRERSDTVGMAATPLIAPDPFGPPPRAPLGAPPPVVEPPPESVPTGSGGNDWPVAKLAALAGVAIGLVLITALFAAWLAG